MKPIFGPSLTKQIDAAVAYYGYTGYLEPGMVHLIAIEGFRSRPYTDDTGVVTFGVGQTGLTINQNFFTEVYPAYVARAERRVGAERYQNMPVLMQNAVLGAVYRGALGANSRTARLLRAGYYVAASHEYLNHAEYRRRKAVNPNDGVVKRMESEAAVFFYYGKLQGLELHDKHRTP